MRALFIAAVAGWGLASGGVAAAARIDLGPYLQDARPDGALVVWETDGPAPSALLLETATGEQRFPTPAGRHHEVRLSGLAAGRYRYRVVTAESSSPPAELATAATGSSFSFLVYGDNRDGHANHARVVSAMVAHHPDLVLNTGDLTSDGDLQPLWRRFFEIEAPLLAGTPLYPALGNHEVKHDPQAAHYHRYFTLPGQPAHSHSARYYSFRYANSLFVALDSNRSQAREQSRWLYKTLESARSDPSLRHLFVYFHHPPFSVGTECGSAIEQGLWVPEFERYKVTAVFVGHEHAYEHMERGGVRYFVTGGGGAPLYTQLGHCPHYDRAALRLFRPEHHFIRVRILGDQATLDAISSDGQSFETVALHEPAPADPPGLLPVPYQETRLPPPPLTAAAAAVAAAEASSPSRPLAVLLAPLVVIFLTGFFLIRNRRRAGGESSSS
jgi:hypothetical protein